MTQRGSILLALSGLTVAAIGAVGVAAGEGTRLSFSEFDPWLVPYAIGLLIALGAAPWGIYDRYAGRIEDRDARWDRALTVWGGFSLLAGLLFFAYGLMVGFDPASASGALAVVGTAACALVFGTLLAFVLTTG